VKTYTVSTLIEAVHALFLEHNLSFGHGTDNAWDEAVALVLGVTHLPDDVQVLAASVSDEQAKQCLTCAQIRVDELIPLAYILGQIQYAGLKFSVEPGVIVPRSPIGLLLHDGLTPWLPERVLSILDLCCGSGVLGIVAAHVFPDAQVTLVDVDAQAVALAAKNVSDHNLSKRVKVVQGDVQTDLEFAQKFDLIITNPPYVDAYDMSVLPAEYAAEPVLALAGGEDGLSIINTIIAKLPQWLAPAGVLVGEVGASAPALLKNYPDYPFFWPELPMGGEGVFVLEGAALNSHTAPRL
jgi:ribosomal protein L3 glutamine methyltransferase